VYDNLNLFAQMPHQMEVFDEGYSEQISDYADSGLMERMMTPAGFQLAKLIDPYTYLSRISVPKLIINGSNDPYWATDALNLYWADLSSPKNVLYAPNQQHSIFDPERIDSVMIEFAVCTDMCQPLPSLSFGYFGSGLQGAFSLEADAEMISAECWIARSPTKDFRLRIWGSAAAKRVSSTEHVCSIEPPRSGYAALFGEAQFAGKTGPFKISTPITIVSAEQ
jgi:PhoPQ-activated pathogenicity-related protein